MLEGLRDLARVARARTSAKVIAVTGSVRKTGTKDAATGPVGGRRDSFFHRVLQQSLGRAAIPARCPVGAKYAVFEIGMNHSGEITPLTTLVRPHVAIITSIEPVHLEYFGSLEKIADAKAEIFAGIGRRGRPTQSGQLPV